MGLCDNITLAELLTSIFRINKELRLVSFDDLEGGTFRSYKASFVKMTSYYIKVTQQ